jgi:hypothetical protein
MGRCLGNRLGKGSAKDWLFLKIVLDFLSINKTAPQNRMEIFESATNRRLLFTEEAVEI